MRALRLTRSRYPTETPPSRRLRVSPHQTRRHRFPRLSRRPTTCPQSTAAPATVPPPRQDPAYRRRGGVRRHARRRRRRHLRDAGRRLAAVLRLALHVPGPHPARADPPRAGRRLRRQRLCAGHRQGGRGHQHVRARRHQHGHLHGQRHHGLGRRGVHHRSGGATGHRLRRLPGSRRHRHFHSHHQAQLPGDGRGRAAARDVGSVPPGLHRPPGPGPRRHSQGRLPGNHHRNRARPGEPARLPAVQGRERPDGS